MKRKVQKLLCLIEGENSFLKQNLKKYSTLTDKDKTVIYYYFSGYSFTDIAGIMNSNITIVKRRYKQIMRKLAIEKDDDLMQFAKTFKIV